MSETCRRILVGLTDDAEGAAAVAFAGRLAERHSACLTIVAATTSHPALLMSPHGAAAWQALPAGLADRLRVSVGELSSRISVTHSLTERNLARALAGTLARESFDVLVLAPSATRRRSVRRLLRREMTRHPCAIWVHVG